MKKKLEIGKTALSIVIFNSAQVSAIFFIIIYAYITRYYTNLGNELFLILVLISTVIINSLITIMSAIPMLRANSQNELLEEALINLESLNNTLRAQRHDFLNHLQVVFGLIELDEYNDAREYIENVYGDIQRVSNVLKTSIPALNALIQSKFYTCEKLSIKAVLNATSQYKDLPVPSWEVCKIIGNLIDNAIYSLKKKEGEKTLEIYLYEDLRSFGFKVKDNGPGIKRELLDKIFDPGFSTKGSEGQGMGLNISKSTLKLHGGSLFVTSTADETVFEGNIPKSVQTTATT